MQTRIELWRRVIEPDWLAWCVFQHLLPRPGLLALADVLVNRVVGEGAGLSSGFQILLGSDEAGDVGVRPLKDHSAVPWPVFNVVRYLFWRNDGFMVPNPAESRADKEETARRLALPVWMLLCGSATRDDLDEHIAGAEALALEWTPSTRGVIALLSAMAGRRPVDECVAAALRLEMPMRAYALKHSADISAQDDDWHDSEVLAAAALRELGSWKPEAAMAEELEPLRAVIRGQLSLASWHAQAEGDPIPPVAETATERLVIDANYSHDLMARENVALARRQAWPDDDRRAIAVQPALLASTHDPRAQALLLEPGNVDRNLARLDAVLRRQVALGLEHDVAETRFCIASLLLGPDPRRALKELIRSGRADAVKHLDWSTFDPTDYSSAQELRGLKALAGRWPGVAEQRDRTYIAAVSSITRRLPDTARETHDAAFEDFLAYARAPYRLRGAIDVSGDALKALAELLEARPWLRRTRRADIGRLLDGILRTEKNWQPLERALEIALTCVRDLGDALLTVVDGTVSLLSGPFAPEAGMWPVIRPALVLLGSDPVIAVVNGKGSEQALVDALMLHFAHPRSQSDPSLLLLILPWTDRLKAHPSFAGALAAAGGEVARLAGELRSSGAGAAQAALLHAARLVGPDLIRTALEALVATLDAANQRTTPPFAFSGSTGALLALCRNHGEVRQVARAEDLEAARSGLDRALRELWRRVAQNPLILAGFSIPERTTAHPTIVHNMALATCAVEDVLELPGLTDVLRAAANEQQQLSVPIQRATTGYAAFKLTGAPSVPLPAGDNAEAFYAALPFELSLVAKLPRESSASVVERAMTGAMRHGPRMEDGGVWLAAALFDLSPDAELLGDYAARIESLDDDDATLSLLRPLVARLRPT